MHHRLSLPILLIIGSLFLSITIGSVAYEYNTSKGVSFFEPIPKKTENITEITPPKCIQNPKITFFMYHYIRNNDTRDTPTTTGLSVPPALFDTQMAEVERLKETGKITLMNGDKFLDALDENCFPGKNIWIFTADDGWVDTNDFLVPIATKYQVPFFLGIITSRFGVAGFVSEQNVVDFSKNPLMTISSHSVTHSEHSLLTKEQEHYEMCESKRALEHLTNTKIRTYIYPSGKMNPLTSEATAIECGYSLAWTTHFGIELVPGSTNFYNINRTRVSHDTPPSFFRELAEKELRENKNQSGSTASGNSL